MPRQGVPFLSALEVIIPTQEHTVRVERIPDPNIGTRTVLIHDCLGRHMCTANAIVKEPYSIWSLAEMEENVERCMNDFFGSIFIRPLCLGITDMITMFDNPMIILNYDR